jgi:hypothetical protein
MYVVLGPILGLTTLMFPRTKLSLSHALSQSVKISLFEELISSTIEQTKDIPKSLSETGKIGVSISNLALLDVLMAYSYQEVR